jgi:hypothetical protein
MKKMRYYDLRANNWTRKVQPHLDDPELQQILVRDFGKFTWGRWEQQFEPGDVPRDFESCDWDLSVRARRPRFWDYCKHAACHWLANFSLKLATLAEPSRPWRIVTSDEHSTVWDGSDTLFDFNYNAMKISPDVCFKAAKHGANAEELQPGAYLEVHLAEHYSVDMARMKRAQATLSDKRNPT